MITFFRWHPVTVADGRPAYQQIADQLRTAIHNGHLPPGTLLPSETELITDCGTSRVTVRAAIRQARTEGLVTTRQGHGTVVRKRPPTTVVHRHTTDHNLPRQNNSPSPGHTQHETVHARMPTPEERDRLDLPASVPVLVIRRPSAEPAGPVIETVLPAERVVLCYATDTPPLVDLDATTVQPGTHS